MGEVGAQVAIEVPRGDREWRVARRVGEEDQYPYRDTTIFLVSVRPPAWSR